MRARFSMLLVLSAIAAGATAAPLTYDVGTVSMHPIGSSDEYIVTGTITTNGTMGPLSASDIVSWSLFVDGPVPYHFQPSNPGGSVSPSFVTASPTSLVTSGQFGWLFVEAEEETIPACSSCSQHLSWRAWLAGDVHYLHYRDGLPDVSAVSTPVSDPFTIATRVPEPLGVSTTLVGIAIVCAAARSVVERR